MVKQNKKSKPPAKQQKKKKFTKRKPKLHKAMVNANANTAKRYMDPEGKSDPPASHTSLGNFTTLNTIVRSQQLSSGTTDYGVYCVVQWTPSSARMINWSWISGTTPTINVTRLGNLITSIPVTSKPLRLSVALRNVTVFTGVEGSVRCLCMPQSIDWSSAFATATTLNDAFCIGIDSMIESNNKTNTFTAAELQHGKKWIFAPVSAVGYNNWYEQIESASAQNTFVNGSIGDAFTTLIIKIPYVTNRNTYDITIRSQDGARYPANSPLANTAKSAPQAQPGVMESIHHIASETSHIAEDVANVFSSVGNAIPRIAGGIYNAFRTGQAVRNLMSSTPLIEEAAEAAPLMLL